VATGAGLILNYHTAYFSLVTRGGRQEAETVLVHGAAGGVGTATLQVAKGLGARCFAVVSNDALRCLNEAGRLVIVGFTAGSIPEIKVNRLLLNNLTVVGAGWGAFVLSKPAINAEIQREVDALIASRHVRPLIGARLPLARAAEALEIIAERRAVGKIVLEL
jgi:NADPH:quinone reductase